MRTCGSEYVMESSDNNQKSIQNAALTVALITNFTTPFSASALNIAVPHIGAEFHVSATSLSWIVLSYLLTTALLSIPFGRLADISGRKTMMKMGILLVCVASALNIFSPNMVVFIILRVLQGVGGAMIFATSAAILVEAYPPEKRGSVLGISSAAVYTGQACGPVIGGMITHAFGWRGVFVALSGLSLIAFITAMLRFPKEARNNSGQKLNPHSIMLYVFSLGLLMYGLATLSQNILSYVLFAAGFILILVFIRHEKRTEVPVVKLQLFTENTVFSLSNLAALFNFASIFAIVFLMSIYLQVGRGFTADVSGLILIAQPIVQTVLSPIAGRLSDRKSPAAIASIGMACCAASLFMFVFLNGQTPISFILAGLVVAGVGVGLFASPNLSIIMGSVSKEDYGVATSVLSTSRSFGQVLGMAILTIIINAVIGSVPIASVASASIVRDMHISFSIFACICVVGVLFSLKRGKAGVGEGA